MASMSTHGVHTIKDTQEQTLTIGITMHLTNPSSETVVYTNRAVGIRVELSTECGPSVVITRIREEVRRTPEWDKANRIDLTFLHCAYQECLCQSLWP